MENRPDSPSPETPVEEIPEEIAENASPVEEEPAEVAAETMETVPLSEEDARDAGLPGQLLEACPACGTLMDVTDQAPFSQIYCPSCGQSLRARKQFNNYKLIQLLGEGGMGSVFKALDCNLNRNVALKILKKECSANAEERAKLEQEARVTASVNHPHVVKVFSFGEDHGQFYLAMELVEKGSLDNLMEIQRRVAEAQILEVGIQIAEGLEAAFERELIHRDIKPGNILFADARTAKLVDFGLAIVMEEAAQARGEIWGTPYYIAPEKLDNQPEDFRSDIYSLGGTLFHALAGRPPYEAATASMVALKQLKSQPISLQAFAPDVSSETAYVINRMLAKNPDERYQTYRELVEHLSYAKHKLLERAEKPHQPKARVVMETQQTRNLTGLLTLGLLLVLVVSGILLYVFRDKVFGAALKQNTAPAATSYSSDELNTMFKPAVQMLANRQFDEARAEFARLKDLPGVTQPMKSWMRMNEALATLAAGDREKAAELFDGIAQDGLYTTEEPGNLLANFFVESSKQLANPDKRIPKSITRLYSNKSFEAFGLLCFALHDWEAGAPMDAGPIFSNFLKSSPPDDQAWIADYKPLANFYLGDYNRIASIDEALSSVKDPASAQALADKLRKVKGELQSGSEATAYLDKIEQDLVAKGAK